MNPTLNMDLAQDDKNNLVRNGPLELLEEKLEKKEAVICVVGLGYVGLPIAVSYAGKGFRTLGIDLDIERVLKLNSGTSCIQDVETTDVKKAVDENLFEAFDHFSPVSESDVIFICVPTPVTAHKDPDTSYITSAAKSISPHLRAGQLIILKSTTFPTATEDLVLPILDESAKKKGLVIGRDYALAFSPERVDPGNQQFHTENTPIVVGGVTPSCTEVAALAVSKIVSHVHKVSSPRVAEMSKLLENIFRSVNIALTNELARLCDRMGVISMWEVVEAAKTKPFGFMPFYPGPGLGGHCIPIDPYYLSWLARKYDFETSFITLSARINEEMPFYVSSAILRAIAEQPVTLSEANVLIMGVAFKRDVDDIRHSPALKLFQILSENGVKHLEYSDPYVDRLRVVMAGREVELNSIDLTEETVERQHVVVIITDHSAFPYEMVAKKARVIVDTRNALNGIAHDAKKVHLLGSGSF